METAATTDTTTLRRVALSALVGTAMEWYDYFVYGIVAALVFDQLFFPSLNPAAGTIAAFLTFAVGFLARPLGAVLFGHFGDRIGRRRTLIATIVLIGIGSGAIGLLPTYDQIGVAAPILLAVLRLVEGLSVGGEWSGAVLLAVEHAPAEKRGFYAATPQFGSPLGTLASSGMVALVTLLPHDAFMSWGWRVPFLVSFPFIGVALYLRLRVAESPEFERIRAEHREPTVPLVEVFRHSAGRAAIAVAATLFASGAFYLMTAYIVHYGTRELGLSDEVMLAGTVLGALLEALGIYIGGRLGDRFPPWAVVSVSALISVITAFPLVGLVGTGNPVLAIIGVGVAIGLIGVPYGPMGAMMADLFPGRVRYSAVAISYNIAGMLGGLVPSVAVFTVAAGNGAIWTVALLLAAIMLISTVGAALAGFAGRRATA